MILLDTDHLTVFQYPEGPRWAPLTARLRASEDAQIATTVVTLEEQMRGWLAEINRGREVRKQVHAYDQLGKVVEFLRDWELVRFDDTAADQYERLRKQRIRIGTQDLRIAAIALVHDALLLSANLRDFKKVPGLRVETG